MGIIATEDDARTIGGSSASYTSNLCATKARADALNCIISGTYDNNLLVELASLSARKKYLKFTTTSSGTFSFTGRDIFYSTNRGDSWIALLSGSSTPTLSSGTEILWRCTKQDDGDLLGLFSSTCNFTASGNIMSLLYGDNFENLTAVMEFCFYFLFAYCTGLTNASLLLLPATTLAEECYENMFVACSAMTGAPALPATTMQPNCYCGMFSGCTSLAAAPALPATTFASACYDSMFWGTNVLPDTSKINFSNLTHVNSGVMIGLFAGTKVTYANLQSILPKDSYNRPCLPLAGSYGGMFEYCNLLTTPPVLPTTVTVDACYLEMFKNSGITTAPVLSATTLTNSCYWGMFKDCTSLTTAPSLPATTLANYCYDSMFWGCTALTTAPTSLPATTLYLSCYEYMFRGCTSLRTAPLLPASTLVSGCYRQMFYGCSSLNNINCLATNISAYNCTNNWVYGVASSGTFTKASSMTSWTRDTNGIPTNWNIVGLNYFKLTTTSSGTFTFTGNNLSYSTNGGASWTTLNSGSATPSFSSGTEVVWKFTKSNDYSSVGSFSSTCSFVASGNAMSLIYGDNFENQTTAMNSCFYYLFYNCSGLTSALNLQLHATILEGSCYQDMFYGCSSLTRTPSLPATALANMCYKGMFSKCSSLTEVPTLPATTLAYACYDSMFSNCTSIRTVPSNLLQVKTLELSCYTSMFLDCTSLTNAPNLPATTLASDCYYSMFNGCTALTAAPSLPATTLASSCYTLMFKNCTTLTSTPTLPATTLAYACYQYMFNGCTSLTSTPTLPVTTLTNYCYYGMFLSCTSLTTAPNLPAISLTNNCYMQMFKGCTSLITAPIISATTLALSCCSNMFDGCTSLITAPKLSATTLLPGCYYRMFYGCSSLNQVECLATNISATNCTNTWLYGVAAKGTFRQAGGVSWSRDVNGIPSTWMIMLPSGGAGTCTIENYGIFLSNFGYNSNILSVTFLYTIKVVATPEDNSVALSERFRPTIIALYNAGTSYPLTWSSSENLYALRSYASISIDAPWVGEGFDTAIHVVIETTAGKSGVLCYLNNGLSLTFDDTVTPYLASYFKMNGVYPVVLSEENPCCIPENESGELYTYIPN